MCPFRTCIQLCSWRLLLSGAVLLRDVQVLTLYKGRYTTARRTSPVLQLQCVGGSAGCGSFVPEVVQCQNKGWDGIDVQVGLIVYCNFKHRMVCAQINQIHLPFVVLYVVVVLITYFCGPFSGSAKLTWTMHTVLDALK